MQLPEPAEGYRVLSKGNFIIEMANELWSYYQTELVNSQELNDQVNQLQQEHAALQEQHANELKMVREEKTQQHARELHQLQGGQQQQPNVAKAWMDKAASLEQELEQLKYQKSVIKRQRDLFAEHCQCWQRRSPSTLIESVIEFVFLLCILRQLLLALHLLAIGWVGSLLVLLQHMPKELLAMQPQAVDPQGLDLLAMLQDLFLDECERMVEAVGYFFFLSLRAMIIVEP